MNIDYSVCQALAYNSEGLPGGMLVYDKFCEWFINFIRRVEDSDHLSIPETMELVGAVDKFHLASHVPECFAKHSLNFLEGAAQLAGSILESLWSDFKEVSGSARAMSNAYRREVYDDHMRDSNFKKMISLGKSRSGNHIYILT
jgi:hypothetical protein